APNLPPLTDRISPALRPQLTAAIAASGLTSAYLDKMKTWMAAFTLVQLQFKALGLKGEAGVEPHLRQAFAAAGKPIGQLETNAEQLSFFDTLSEPAQRAFLEGAITDPGNMRTEFSGMLKSWATGDVAGIAQSFNADLAASPELRANLLTKRNRNWSQWVERKLVQPGTTMVAVGAGHLAGDDSVVAMLQRDGYKVQRVE
ncbi:MAG: TraB/GumN family protein, partial [Sphingomicrobium sp.]